VLTCSALTGDQLDRVWQAALDHRAALAVDGRLARLRAEQDLHWLGRQVRGGLADLAFALPAFAAAFAAAEQAVAAGRAPPTATAAALLARLRLALDAG